MADKTTAEDAGEVIAQPAEAPTDAGVAAGGAAETSGNAGPAEADAQAVVVAGEPGDAAAANGEAQPTVDTGKAEDTGAVAKPGTPRVRLAAVVLGVVTVLLGGFGAWATAKAHSLRASAAPPNLALTDAAATSAVKRQISSAVNTVFSYNYADTAATRQAAQSLLTGPAIRQYDTYFALVTRDAPAQKLVVTTRVTNVGVELLDGNRARVLVFANQQDTRAGTSQTSYAGALFAVTAVNQGGRWKIENIDTFTGR